MPPVFSLLVSFDVKIIPRLYRGKKKERSYKKEDELYASPTDVKTMLKMFAQHRKKSCDPFTGCSACDAIISFGAPFRGGASRRFTGGLDCQRKPPAMPEEISRKKLSLPALSEAS